MVVRRKQEVCGGVLHDQLTVEQCNQLIANPFVHPVTKEALEIGSETHNNLMQECSHVLATKDLAHEIMVHITNDQSAVAQKFCLAAVNNATTTNEIYDPVSKTKREITSVYSKALLENCARTHNIVFLHLQIEDDGVQTFLPFPLLHMQDKNYEIPYENMVNAVTVIDAFIDKWASPNYRVNVATIDALIFGLEYVLTTPASHKYSLRLRRKESDLVSHVVTRLHNLKSMAESGVQDAERLPPSIKTQLKQKAVQARTKMAYKKEMDKNCSATKQLVHRKYTTLILQKYLSEFINSKTLDIPVKQFYKDNNVSMYNDIALEEVSSDNYIFLQDKHKQTHVSEDWLRKQHEYILSLSIEQLFNIYGYTHHGDEQVNNYLRGTFDEDLFMGYISDVEYLEDSTGQTFFRYFPLFFPTLKFINMHYTRGAITEELLGRHFSSSSHALKNTIKVLCDPSVPSSQKYGILINDVITYINIESWNKILEIYSRSLEEIIRNAPPTTEPMYLYRGVETDFYLKGFMNSRKKLFKPKSFVSTSSSITVAHNFTDSSSIFSDCCFMRLFVPVGTCLLFVTGLSQHMDESEFLLNKDVTFYIEKSSTETFCESKYLRYKMRVSDIKVM